MDVGPGDLVVCVDASPDRVTGAQCPLAERNLYQIEHVWVIDDKRDGRWGVCYDLVGVERMNGDVAYNADRFRPIRKPPIPAEILALQTPANEREREGV